MKETDTPIETLRRAVDQRKRKNSGKLTAKVVHDKNRLLDFIQKPSEGLSDGQTPVFSARGNNPSELLSDLREGMSEYGLNRRKTVATLDFIEYLADQFEPQGGD